MLDPAISQFFAERKEAWLKKNLKSMKNEDKIKEVTAECERIYAFDNWIVFAANCAYKRALSSHPSKFSHPDVGASPTNLKNKNYVTPIIFKGQRSNDGYLRTGNVDNVKLDSTGNGAEVTTIGEISSFLSIYMSDGTRLYEHLNRNSDEVKVMLKNHHFEEVRDGLLEMIKKSVEYQTNSKIKQVYFPTPEINGDYHQLSVLTPSGIVFDLRKRLDDLHSGDEVKASRESRKNKKQGSNYKEVYDLTTIGYGGAHPKNISVLNNTNGGKAHLFMSMPPTLENREIIFPTSDFFSQSVYYRGSIKPFYALHEFYLQRKNNMDERARRDALYQDVIDDIIEKLCLMRNVAQEQFIATHSALSSAQRIWLKVLEAPEDDLWLDDILKSITHFIYHGYEKVLNKKAIKLGDAEYKHIASIVELNKEVLR